MQVAHAFPGQIIITRFILNSVITMGNHNSPHATNVLSVFGWEPVPLYNMHITQVSSISPARLYYNHRHHFNIQVQSTLPAYGPTPGFGPSKEWHMRVTKPLFIPPLSDYTAYPESPWSDILLRVLRISLVRICLCLRRVLTTWFQMGACKDRDRTDWRFPGVSLPATSPDVIE